MKFDPVTFRAAFAELIDADLAQRLGLGSEPVRGEDLGAAISSALTGASARDCVLAAVVLQSDAGQHLTLSAEDAEAHPLLDGWLSPNLAAAIGHPIEAGSILAGLAPAEGQARSVELVERGDAGLRGLAVARFASTEGALTATAFYGPITANPARIATHRLDGAALYAVGRRAYAAGPLVSILTAAEPDQAGPAMGTRH